MAVSFVMAQKLFMPIAKPPCQKVSIVTRKAMGGAYVAMGSRQMLNDITYAWPTGRIAVMGPEGAVRILSAKKSRMQKIPQSASRNF